MVARLRRDEGLTLIEMTIAITLLIAVTFIFLPLMEQSTTRTNELAERSGSLDAARIALSSIDREFRGADRVCSPQVNGDDAGNLLTFRSRTNVDDDTIDKVRIDYRVLNGVLERSENNGTWRTVVEGVENESLGADAFVMVGDSLPSRGEVLEVHLWVDTETGDRAGPVHLTTELAARNIYAPTDLTCNV